MRWCKGAPNIKQIPYDKHRDIHNGPGGGPYNERFKEEIEKLGGFDKVKPMDVTNIRDRLTSAKTS